MAIFIACASVAPAATSPWCASRQALRSLRPCATAADSAWLPKVWYGTQGTVSVPATATM